MLTRHISATFSSPLFCDPGEIRTHDPPLKRRVLSSLTEPAELRGHKIDTGNYLAVHAQAWSRTAT